MNTIHIGATKHGNYWLGYFRFGTTNEVVRRGGKDIRFGSELEAKSAAADALCEWVNTRFLERKTA